MGTIEGGCVERQAIAGVQSHAHGGSDMVGTDDDAGSGGDGGFEFDAEGDAFGLGILRFHLWIWLDMRPVRE
jgi:hypothetical protein